MNIIFIAPPAAGKGTQAKILCEKYGLLHISTGDLLRKASKENLELQEKMNAGQFIDDSIILNLIDKEINVSQEKNGYVLDGFPRNMDQAKAFDQMIHDKHFVIYIEVSKDIAKDRILGRLYCPECGSSYNEFIIENWPKIHNVCDKCHSILIKRTDDTEITFENRFDVYIKHTEPLLEYYRSQNVLYTIDGNQDTMKVHSDIVKVLEGEL